MDPLTWDEAINLTRKHGRAWRRASERFERLYALQSKTIIEGVIFGFSRSKNRRLNELQRQLDQANRVMVELSCCDPYR